MKIWKSGSGELGTVVDEPPLEIHQKCDVPQVKDAEQCNLHPRLREHVVARHPLFEIGCVDRDVHRPIGNAHGNLLVP